MKYLSTFSGVGGFELGIEKAHESRLYYKYFYEPICNAHGGEDRGEQGDTESNKGQGLLSKERKEISAEERPTSERNHNITYERPLCIGFSEIDKYATKVYQHHFPTHYAYGDITKINEATLPDFDLLVGGFPCQSFSIAGKRGGFLDTRGTLFFEIARIVREKQPRLLLLENVKGLLSHDQGRTFFTIISTLDELGYDLQWQVLNAKDFGVPQNRERVFIVANLRGSSRPEVFPIGENGNPLTKKNGHQISQSSISGTLTATDAKMHLDGTYIKQLNNPTHSNDRVYGTDGVSPTLNTMQGGRRQPFIPEGARIRRLTPLETERLMGLPDGWTNVEGMSDTQRYKQCGNGVVTNVVQAIVEKLL
jgi:DNA (cytosine-5)-methyltransferase 1